MTLEEPRTVNLVFASAAALDAATLTVSLPDGIELAGFPGQTQITWQTSLVEGKNFLPLELIALSPAGGEVLALTEKVNETHNPIFCRPGADFDGLRAGHGTRR